jgi:hypothetical protein
MKSNICIPAVRVSISFKGVQEGKFIKEFKSTSGAEKFISSLPYMAYAFVIKGNQRFFSNSYAEFMKQNPNYTHKD